MTNTEPYNPINWRLDLPPFLLFLLLPMLAFADLFFQTKTLYKGDISWLHYPLRVLSAEQWLSGHVPLWNPYTLGGAPLLAEPQIGVLQPLNALFLLPIPSYFSLTLFVSLNITLAAMFSYILARSLYLGRAGATMTGLCFGFGGVIMAQIINLNIMTGAVWIPLVFCGLVWTLRTRRTEIAILAGIPLALQIVAANPQVSFFTALLLASYTLYESIRQRVITLWGLFSLMFGTGLLLAAPQILPTWEMQQHSIRADGVGFGDMTFFSMPPVQWLVLILPSLFGNTVTSYQGLAGNFAEMTIYIGIVPVLLVGFSWFARQEPMVRFLGLVTLLGVILSAGDYTPLFDWLQYLPGFNLFRAPTRWLLMVNFTLAILAGYGFEALLHRPPSKRIWQTLIGLWLMVILVLSLIWWFRQPLFEWADGQPVRTDLVKLLRWSMRRGLFEWPDDYNSYLLHGLFSPLLMPALALVSRLGVGILLIIGYGQGRLTRQWFVLLTLALVAFDLTLSGGSGVNPVTSAEHWQQGSSAITYLQQQTEAPQARFFTEADSDEDEVVMAGKHYFSSVYELLGSGGYSPLRLARYYTFMNQSHPLLKLSLTGTRFVLSKERLTADAESVMTIVHEDAPWYLYDYPDTLPRTFVMRDVTIAKDDETVIAQLQNGAFDPRQTLLLQPEVGQTMPTIPPPTTEIQTDELTIQRDEPSLVEIQTSTAADGFLVLLDTYYPGWQAYIDGEAQPTYRAYYRNRAIYLPAGQHTVQFIYQPTSFYIGLLCAMFGLSLCIWAIWWGRRVSGSHSHAEHSNKRGE
ncbi:YfhO family protein [Anaerolineales bacterium HSG25]|nr:YfhO family protein [Anaerolineales bacterium HSG25]